MRRAVGVTQGLPLRAPPLRLRAVVVVAVVAVAVAVVVEEADVVRSSPSASLSQARAECPPEHRSYVFEHGWHVVQWHRESEFQLRSLKLVAEQMLLGCPRKPAGGAGINAGEKGGAAGAKVFGRLGGTPSASPGGCSGASSGDSGKPGQAADDAPTRQDLRRLDLVYPGEVAPHLLDFRNPVTLVVKHLRKYLE